MPLVKGEANASSSVLQPLSSTSWGAGSWQRQHPLPHFTSQALTPVLVFPFFPPIALDCSLFYSAFLRMQTNPQCYHLANDKALQSCILKLSLTVTAVCSFPGHMMWTDVDNKPGHNEQLFIRFIRHL